MRGSSFGFGGDDGSVFSVIRIAGTLWATAQHSFKMYMHIAPDQHEFAGYLHVQHVHLHVLSHAILALLLVRTVQPATHPNRQCMCGLQSNSYLFKGEVWDEIGKSFLQTSIMSDSFRAGANLWSLPMCDRRRFFRLQVEEQVRSWRDSPA